MPEMGRPVSLQERSYSQVTMAPRRSSEDVQEMSGSEKEKLLNKLSGGNKKTAAGSIYQPEDKKHNEIGKDEFLKLLSHQLQNQDPMNPMEQNKFAAELAQFSQLEQLTNLNSKFDKLTGNAGLEDKFYGASFLGKEIVTNGSSVKFDGEGTNAPVMFSLEAPAQKVMIRIFDKNNNMVGEMWKENLGQGAQQIQWDGEGVDKRTVAKGEYSVNVKAWGADLKEVAASTKVTGLVESVFFENGESVLMVDGRKVFLRDVDSFHMPSSGKAQARAAEAAKNSKQNMPVATALADALNSGSALPSPAPAANAQQALNAYEKSVYDE